MKKVVVVFNGGTISMKVDPRIKAAVPTLTGEEIMAMVTGIEKYANIECKTFSNLPGPHMTPEIMLDLSKYVQKLLEREEVEGVVVTHGTDSLEETAFFLDLTIKSEKPVVFTGAMRSSSELGYDGPFNLAASICTAISEEAKNRGVLLCLNGELHCASEVTKINTMSLNAFITPNFGPIGIVDNNEARFYRNSIKKQNIQVEKINAEVDLIKVVAGLDSKLIDFCISKGDKGIIVEAMGRGNIPPKMLNGIKNAIDNDVVVVLVSRCIEGRVFDSYGYPGAGKELKKLGVIFGDNIPGQKARIKLLLALSSSMNKEEIRAVFDNH